MATTRFNNVILDVARILKSGRTLATENVEPYSSALLSRYVNKSVRDFLVEQFTQLGMYIFPEIFPEYIKTSGNLALSTGVVVKPSDAFEILELKQGNLKFWKVPQKNVESVRTGTDKEIIPSSTRPVFWEENGNIYTLGITTGNVIARYIVTHQDISPITTANGNGKYRSSGTTVWTAATRTLSGATMSTAFASTDVNKPIMLKDSSNVIYFGIIESYVSATSVTIRGDGIPATDKSITDVQMADVEDSTDLKLNDNWTSEITKRAVAYAIADSQNTQLK